MMTDQIGTEHRGEPEVWGAPQHSPRRWGVRETAAAVAVAAVIAALGGAAVYAATAGNPHPFGGSHRAFGSGGGMPAVPRGPNPQHGATIGGPGPDSSGETSLHGEFVVPDRHGFTTVLTQTGTVTAISTTSVTVRSADGYHQTYVIPPTAGNAGAPFAVNDQVVVRATRDGQTATVTNIGKPLQMSPPGPSASATPGGASGPSAVRPHN